MSETRKLVAILVADVVGYSRLAGADEDHTLARNGLIELNAGSPVEMASSSGPAFACGLPLC
jgi:hypothetical protein